MLENHGCDWEMGSRGDEPGVVKGTNFVGVKRDGVSILVTVIGGIGSNVGSLKRDQNRENQSQSAPSHCRWRCTLVRSSHSDQIDKEKETDKDNKQAIYSLQFFKEMTKFILK